MDNIEPPVKERYITVNGRATRRCQAMSQRSKKQCKKWAITDREVCRSHGGATPRGIDSANFRHGAYSKDLPARLSRKLDEARSDPQSLSTFNEILVIQARLSDLMEKLKSADSEERWKGARDAFAVYRDEVQSDGIGSVRFQEAEGLLFRYFSEGAEEFQLWRNIYEAMHVKTKLTDSYTKRMASQNMLYTHSEITSLLGSILRNIDTLVDSPETRSRIHNSIHRTINLKATDYKAA